MEGKRIMDRFENKYTVYWEHPSQGKYQPDDTGYKGDGKQYTRLGNAIKFIRKLQEDEDVCHIDIKWISSTGSDAVWHFPKQEPYKFISNTEVVPEELPDWLMGGWK